LETKKKHRKIRRKNQIFFPKKLKKAEKMDFFSKKLKKIDKESREKKIIFRDYERETENYEPLQYKDEAWANLIVQRNWQLWPFDIGGV
jgi:hypothetical protein